MTMILASHKKNIQVRHAYIVANLRITLVLQMNSTFFTVTLDFASYIISNIASTS